LKSLMATAPNAPRDAESGNLRLRRLRAEERGSGYGLENALPEDNCVYSDVRANAEVSHAVLAALV